MILTQPPEAKPLKSGSGLKSILYPNGECVVYKPRKPGKTRLKDFFESEYNGGWKGLCSALLFKQGLLPAKAVLLGLSPLPIFDSVENGSLEEGLISRSGRATKGLKGITPHGRRMVRNAAHLIEREGGRGRAVFATVTVPQLPLKEMRLLHERWHKATEIYRLGLKRALQAKGLSGESVSVSEIQEKRYKRTGIPILHIHSVFVGKTSAGRWAISTEDHDRIWLAALNVTIGTDVKEAPSSCNLQRVKQSTEGYIGKYMSKGVQVVGELVRVGFTSWIPKHWWACSRTLRARIDSETRRIHELADWLNDAADLKGSDVWKRHRPVVVETFEGDMITIARYGRLSIGALAEIEKFYAGSIP